MLNQRLIQAPVDTIDYVITHELCHLLERDHSPRFFRLLKRVMERLGAEKTEAGACSCRSLVGG